MEVKHPASWSQNPDENSSWVQAELNPRNWPRNTKYRALGLVSLQAFISPLASSIMAPGLPEISERYEITSDTVVALTLTVYFLAWALAPLVFGPLSERIGRKMVIDISGVIFTAFSIACIFAQSTGQLIAFRFLAGIGASTPISIAGAVIWDLFVAEERAPANALYGLGLLIGTPTGPIMGGYLTETAGVKYGFILTASLAALATLLSIALFPETDHRTVIRRGLKHSPIREELEGYARTLEMKNPLSALHSALLPVLLLLRSPICLLLSLYGAFVYGLLNMFFTTFPTIFGETYGFGPGATGLTYIGGGLGEICATVLGGLVGNSIYKKLLKNNAGASKPEFRIPGMLLGSLAIPIGLFWFGWTAQTHQHWILPILGSTIFGFGLMSILLPLQLYLLDAFPHYAASALAAAALLRSLLAFAIPLFAPQMINSMGLGGTYSLLGGVSIVFGIPLPLWIYFRGEEIRAKSKWNE